MDFCRTSSSSNNFSSQRRKNGEIYCIGNECKYTKINLVKLILEKLEISENIIAFDDDKLDHDYRYSVDSKKIKDRFKQKPVVPFLVGLEKILSWYKSYFN